MSTRGATGFIYKGKWYVTYNHSDSYPEGLGMDVLEFCKHILNWNLVKPNVENLILVDEIDDIPTDEDVEKYRDFSDTSVGSRDEKDWYCLLRNLQGANGLWGVANGAVKHMIDYHQFLGESLFCEWAYVIDLDLMRLLVFKGFNKEVRDVSPVLPPDIDPTKPEPDYHEYYPVRLLYAYDLYNLPEFMLGVTNEFKKSYRLHQESVK